MSKRLDPANDIRENRGSIDFGDKASTYIFDGGVQSVRINPGNQGGVHTLFKEFARTSDFKWASDFDSSDGGKKGRLELFNDDGSAADDFVALMAAAVEGQGGLVLNINAFDEVMIEAPGRWSTDHLVFKGDWVTDALMKAGSETGFDLFNPKDQIKVFDFDREGRNESIYTGRTDNLDQSEGAVGAILDGSFLNDKNGVDGELGQLIFAAMDEKFGIGETKDLEYVTDDGDQIIVKVTNQHWKGPATDTMILKGADVEAILDAYTGQFRSGLDTGDGKSRLAYYYTDANAGGSGGVWFGGGVNGVTFDSAGAITLNDVVGNGLTQKENNLNREWQDDIDEFVFNALEFSGDSDVEVIAGGEKGDDFMTVAMKTDGGNTDTLILEGARVGEAIDFYADTGGEFDFFA